MSSSVEPERRLSGAFPGHRDALGRSGVAGGEARLVEAERVRLVVAQFGVETATVRSEDALDALGGAAGDVGGLGAGGCVQCVEDEGSGCVVAHVHAIEGENVEVDVEPDRAVGSLDRGHRAGVCASDTLEAELELGFPSERAVELGHERAQDFGAQRPVVSAEGAQAPG